MINVSFYLSAPKAKNFSSLYVSIISGGERLRFPTGEKFPAEYCHLRKKKGKELLKKNSTFYLELDKKLKDLKTVFFQIAFDLQKKYNRLANPVEIKTEYFHRHKDKSHNQDEDIFMKVYKEFMQSGEITNSNSEGSQNLFRALENHLLNFETHRKKKLTFAEVNLVLWESIRSYFSIELKFSNTTSNNYLKRIRRFFAYCIEHEYLDTKIPLKKFKNFEELHTDDMALIALDEKELEKILALDLSENHEQELVRDQFLVECYTGQRYSDLENVLNTIDLKKDSVSIYQTKTNAKVTIPITEKLREQIVKIKNRYQKELIPVLSNTDFNTHLKAIGEKAEINSTVTVLTLKGKQKEERTCPKYELLGSHTGRRTFCTYVISKGIEAELIMRVTGHKTYASFRKYLRLNDTMMQNEFLNKF